MASACALAIISGKKFFNFGIAERLRALRYPIFTGWVASASGSCRAAFCESAALRGRGLALSVTYGDSSPKGGASGETAHFACEPEALPPCQELSLWESWRVSA